MEYEDDNDTSGTWLRIELRTFWSRNQHADHYTNWLVLMPWPYGCHSIWASLANLTKEMDFRVTTLKKTHLTFSVLLETLISWGHLMRTLTYKDKVTEACEWENSIGKGHFYHWWRPDQWLNFWLLEVKYLKPSFKVWDKFLCGYSAN